MLGRTYFLICDACRGKGPSAGTSQDARQLAKRHGWRRVPKRSAEAGGSLGADYCPICT